MDYLIIHDEVATAKAENKPIVALESTIIAHGMPYPQNVETALEVVQQVRSYGAIPATIAIMDGRLKAGLTLDEIDFLGKQGQKITKTSRRDIPYLLANQGHGATTVAATMIIADLADIRVFATGGIGGVHRGASTSMDISSDLQELSRTNVGVVSAGAKAILDLSLTLEYLETHGVPVLGYQTQEFPAFYTRKSGLSVDYRMDTPAHIAGFMKAKWEVGLQGGVLIANPIPELAALEYESINEVIKEAIEESQKQGIRGKAITPFLLKHIVKITGGESLKANIELVLNNAALGAQIAQCLTR